MVCKENGGRPVFFWVIRRNEFDQRSLKHRLLHLLEEHLFVRLLDVQIELQSHLDRNYAEDPQDKKCRRSQKGF
jgi:hypothetical protein